MNCYILILMRVGRIAVKARVFDIAFIAAQFYSKKVKTQLRQWINIAVC